MGIVAGERVFEVLDTEDYIDAKGSVEMESFKGNISFTDVHFSYIKNEEF